MTEWKRGDAGFLRGWDSADNRAFTVEKEASGPLQLVTIRMQVSGRTCEVGTDVMKRTS